MGVWCLHALDGGGDEGLDCACPSPSFPDTYAAGHTATAAREQEEERGGTFPSPALPNAPPPLHVPPPGSRNGETGGAAAREADWRDGRREREG
jgi:hypothetical protein